MLGIQTSLPRFPTDNIKAIWGRVAPEHKKVIWGRVAPEDKRVIWGRVAPEYKGYFASGKNGC